MHSKNYSLMRGRSYQAYITREIAVRSFLTEKTVSCPKIEITSQREMELAKRIKQFEEFQRAFDIKKQQTGNFKLSPAGENIVVVWGPNAQNERYTRLSSQAFSTTGS
jgi:hypothetical protein